MFRKPKNVTWLQILLFVCTDGQLLPGLSTARARAWTWNPTAPDFGWFGWRVTERRPQTRSTSGHFTTPPSRDFRAPSSRFWTRNTISGEWSGLDHHVEKRLHILLRLQGRWCGSSFGIWPPEFWSTFSASCGQRISNMTRTMREWVEYTSKSWWNERCLLYTSDAADE